MYLFASFLNQKNSLSQNKTSVFLREASPNYSLAALFFLSPIDRYLLANTILCLRKGNNKTVPVFYKINNKLLTKTLF